MNRRIPALAAALMVRLLAACGASNVVPTRAAPDLVDKVGALELVTHECVSSGHLQPALLCAVTGGGDSLGRVQTALAGQAQAPAEGQASANRCRRAPHRQASLRPLASCRRLNE